MKPAVPKCLACARGVPPQGRRRCPECGHAFRGPGWDGIDVHWRARHGELMAYEAFWSSLCDAHRARGVRSCPSCRKGIPAAWPTQCPECAQVFRGAGRRKLDAHWKSRHQGVMRFEDFLASLCPAHRRGGDPGAGVLPFGRPAR